MFDEPPVPNGVQPQAVANEAEQRLVSSALKEFDGVGIREILDQDSRPTFVIDLDPDLEFASEQLSPFFGNASIRTYERLWDVVCGVTNDEPAATADAYAAFRAWTTSRTAFDESGDIFPSTHVFRDMLWTGSTVRKRWRLISGNKCFQLPVDGPVDLSSGPPSEVAGFAHQHRSPKSEKRRRIRSPSPRNSETTTSRSVRSAYQEAVASSHRDSTVISSFNNKQTTRSGNPHDSSYSSAGGKSTHSISLNVDHLAADWTLPNPRGTLSSHVQFARAIDWSATPLGPLESWSREFRQVANLLMKNPHPAALFWGHDLTMMYNEAYRDVVAGRKHPALMGTGFKGPFSETWDSLAELFTRCAQTGNSIAMSNQPLPMERHGFIEETFFTWSFTPLYGSGTKVLGFYNAPFETTEQVVNQRRSQTLLQLGEETALARSVSGFWQAVLRALEDNHFDIPVAILYSVVDYHDDGESSSHSGSSMSLKSCLLEGSLGIPEGHPAAPARLDLKRSTEGFIPSFREAMRTREPTKLQTRDGTLPESLIEGIEWRGFEDPCREAIIFPVRPTNGENVMSFLLIGVNPRRPYDEGYRSFVNMLNRQLATSLASIILFEDEIRRGQTAAEAAAKEKEQLSEQLAAQTLRMQRMAETSPVGMYYIDHNGVLVECNDKYLELTGHSREDTRSMSFKDGIHEDSLEAAMVSWHRYTVERLPWSGELRLKKPWVDPVTGEVLENWILAGGQPEFHPDGSFRSVMGSITDISRIKWAEGLQTRRLLDAEETRRQTNNFLDLTSHEMRNPLSAMIHCADEIQTVLKDPVFGGANVPGDMVHECIEAAETIALCAQHQKSIVDDILTVSKLDSDLLLITPTLVEPAAIARQAVKMFYAELHKKDIRAEYQVDASFDRLGVDKVLLDHSRLLQVLINLLTNAIKFTQSKDKREIRVRLAASLTPPHPDAFDFEYIEPKNPGARTMDSEDWGSEEELYLQFEVADTGRGLTRDEKKRLFQRFSQATPRTHAQYGGSGLGLFISRQLTELHGGQIGVGSEAGVGSTFAFYVRCRRGTVPQNGVEPDREAKVKKLHKLKESLPLRTDKTPPVSIAPSAPLVDYKQLHVLIVEDNLVNQKVLSKQLKKLGCNVELADHGGHALAYLEKTEFWKGQLQPKKLSVILMDLEMPVMDGLTCVKNIRELERQGQITSHIPVIAVTANVRSELVAHARETGMDDVVSKPFRIPELIAKIGEVLGA